MRVALLFALPAVALPMAAASPARAEVLIGLPVPLTGDLAGTRIGAGGDITGYDTYACYVWQGGDYVPPGRAEVRLTPPVIADASGSLKSRVAPHCNLSPGHGKGAARRRPQEKA